MNEKLDLPNLAYIEAIATAVKSLGEVPSGHLYARCMEYMTIQQYESVIFCLTSTKLISAEGHLLKWVGPKAPTP